MSTQKESSTNEVEKKAVEKKDTASAKKTTAKKAIRKGKWGIVGIILVLCIAVIGALYLIVYQYPQQNAVRNALVSTLPFPVAYVEGSFVTVEEYEHGVDGVMKFFEVQEEQQLGLVEQQDNDTIRTQELDRFIRVALLDKIAKEQGISVTSEELETYFEQEILPQSPGGIEEATTTFKDLYNWTVEDFKKYVLYEVVLSQRINESYVSDESKNAELRAEATALYNEIQEGNKPFSELAKEHSDDTVSAANGGMLGYFGKGVMIEEFEQAAFALEVGEVSQPIKTSFGYHIIKVTDRDDEAGSIQARHILLAFPSVYEQVDELKESSTIVTLLPQY